MSEWQPINTAPRDGTFIVGWCPQQQGSDSPVRIVSSHGRQWVSNPGRWTCHPTFWMALPAPPEPCPVCGFDPYKASPRPELPA